MLVLAAPARRAPALPAAPLGSKGAASFPPHARWQSALHQLGTRGPSRTGGCPGL